MSEAVDFAVIGAGIAGASAAYELAAHGSVAVFEMETTAGHHSTGRSAALYTECDGPELLRRLALASKEFLTDPPAGFADSAILHDRGVLFVAPADAPGGVTSFFEQQRALVPDIELFSIDAAVGVCEVLRADAISGGVFEPHAKDIDVHALHQGFLRGLRNRGGLLHLSSPVTALEPVTGGWRITGGEQSVVASSVVNAAGAWCDEVARLAGVPPIGLVPKRRTAFTFAPPADVSHQQWPMIVDLESRFYFRPEGPNILASPMDQTPVPPQDIRHEEIDVARAIESIAGTTTLDVRHVQAAWAGLRSFVADDIPVVGLDPTAAGFFWLAGQGGYGIMTSPAMSRAITALILDDRLPADIAALGVTRAALAPQRIR